MTQTKTNPYTTGAPSKAGQIRKTCVNKAPTTRQLGLLVAVVGVVLAGCSTEPEPENTEPPTVDELLATDARDDQRAAGAAAQQAFNLGFDQQLAASAAEIEETRNAFRTDAQSQQTSVTPPMCQEALVNLDWSPMLSDIDDEQSADAGAEINITRLDFGAETFEGTGSIEIAELGTSQDYQDYVDTVERLTTDCNDLHIRVATDAEPIEYTFRAESVEFDQGTGLMWARAPIGTGEPMSSMVLTQQVNGYAVMVSFAGSNVVQEQEFAEMGRGIIAAAAAELSDE